MRHPTQSVRCTKHRGVVLPVVLVGVLVVALIGAAMARTVLLQRRWARQAEQQQQAAWLADSALQRSLSRLSQDENYTGETWRVSAEQMPRGDAGVAEIRIESSEGIKKIVVEAVFPEHPRRRILQRRERIVEPKM